MTYLLFEGGLQAGSRRSLKEGEMITVGESYDNDLVVLNTSEGDRSLVVSLSHGGIVKASRFNGSLSVNDVELAEELEETVLNNNDFIMIGQSKIRIVSEQSKAVTTEGDVVVNGRGPALKYVNAKNGIYVLTSMFVVLYGLFSFKPVASSFSDPSESTFPVDKFLHEIGYEHLDIVMKPGRPPAIRGLVGTEAEIVELDKLLLTEGIHAEVQLTSDEKIVFLANRILGSTEMSISLEATHSDSGSLAVSGLIQSAEAWGKAKKTLMTDIPQISSLDDDKVVTYQKLARHFQSLLERRGIRDLTVRVEQKKIHILGELPEEESMQLTSMINEIELEYSSAGLFDLEISPSVKLLDSVNVISVSEKPVPYFVTDKGEVVFVGGKLDGGYVVIDIQSKGIYFRQGSDRYLLRLES